MKRFLECVERILGTVVIFLASLGLFYLVCYVKKIVSEEPLPQSSMGIVFMLCMLLVFCLTQGLAEVRYKRLEILAYELESQNEEAEKLYEHLRVK